MDTSLAKRPKLIAILGPTASGKTSLSLKLAKKFNGFIISADSRQIYKYMDIGTAKIKKEEMQTIPHFMIDIVEPDQIYTVAQYQKEVYKILDSKISKEKISFLVGGTGLYISAVINGLKIPQVKPDKKLREKLNKKSVEKLVNMLKKLDKATFEKIDLKNKRRLTRAIEVCLKTGKKFSEIKSYKKPNFDVLQIGPKIDKNTLNKNIDQRVDNMTEQGLTKEVKGLLKKGYNFSLPSLSGLGYKQIGMYLRNEITLEEAIKLIKLRTRQYAKRQMTWFKRDKRIRWIKNYKEAEKLVANFLSNN